MSKTFDNLATDKQAMIVKAAFKEFSFFGFENSSTNRLVKNLAISKGSLFKYFPSKLDLYSFLVDIAVERLITHIDLYEVTGESWRKRLLNYASIEFDFLIKEPDVYRFFNNLIKELELPHLIYIKDNLLEISNLYLAKIFSLINLPKDNYEFLILHITFILKGYNEYFLKTQCNKIFTSDDKTKYLIGLESHLDFMGYSK